jgi:hypothetical protein
VVGGIAEPSSHRPQTATEGVANDPDERRRAVQRSERVRRGGRDDLIPTDTGFDSSGSCRWVDGDAAQAASGDQDPAISWYREAMTSGLDPDRQAV